MLAYSIRIRFVESNFRTICAIPVYAKQLIDFDNTDFLKQKFKFQS